MIETITVTLPPGPQSLPLLRSAVQSMYERAAGTTLDNAATNQLETTFQALTTSTSQTAIILKTDEATLTIWANNNPELSLSIFLPTSLPQNRDNNNSPEGLGMGIHLIREVVDEVSYLPQAGNNRWHLSKVLPLTDDSAQTLSTPIVVSLKLPVSLKYLNVTGNLIDTMLARLPSLQEATQTSYAVQLAVQEACTNIVKHAYGANATGEISTTITLNPDLAQITIELEDSGQNTFDLDAIPNPFPMSPPTSSGLLSGSSILFISMTIVNAGNYIFNLALGRWLGPAAFADLSLIVTLMLIVTLVTATFQTVAAKFSAVYTASQSLSALAGLRQWMGKRAWLLGLVVMLLFGLGAPLWQQFFHTQSYIPFIILAIGLPIYFAQGVDRGILQGQTRFGLLSLSYQAEMWVRLIGAIALVALGFAVNGAVAGLTLSFVATWVVARQVRKDLPGSGEISQSEAQVIGHYAGPVIAALVGQILINNSDILIVKRFFPAEAAGQYAALALIGRIVFFATWSIVTTLFPIVAQKHEKGEAHRYLLWASLGIVLAVSIGIIAFSYFFPDFIVGILFGEAYLAVAPLLWLYAVATMFYALANVVITYRLSIGSGFGSYLAVFAGVAQVTVLWLFHGSLQEVVFMQIHLMSTFLLVLLVWDTWLNRQVVTKS